MSSLRLPVLTFALALLSTIACTPRPETAAPAESGKDAEKVHGDLTPVATPDNLVGLGRIHNAAALLDELAGQAKLTTDWRQALRERSAAVAGALDLAKSLDFAMVVHRPAAAGPASALVAISFAVTSVASAESLMGEMELDSVPDAVRTYAGSERQCEIAAARDAVARVVCSFGPKAAVGLAVLSPYLRRGVETGRSAPEAQFSLYAEPMRRVFESEISQGEAAARAGLTGLVNVISDNELRIAVATAGSNIISEMVAWIHDIESCEVELGLAADQPGVNASFHAQFRGRRSFLVQSLERANRVTGPAPELFWNQAANVVSASYSRSVPAPESAAILANIESLLRGGMRLLPGHTKKKNAVVDAIVASLDSTQKGEFVAVSPAPRQQSDAKSPGSDLSFMPSAVAAFSPAPKADPADLFTAIVDLYNDRSTRRALAKAWPDVTFDRVWERVALTTQPTPRGSGLPRNARTFAADIILPQQAGAESSRPIAFGLVTAVAPSHACLGVGAAPPAVLQADVAQCIAPTGPTLASRPDLSDLRTHAAMSAGFMNLNRVIRDALARISSAAAASNADYQPLADAIQASAPAPTASPVVRTSMTMNDLRVSLRMSLPAAALADLAGLSTTVVEHLQTLREPAAEEHALAPVSKGSPTL
ncbi:MAG: hypothetical protein B7733_04800 [Myxococcales bacterium FL481]|nr:MAG: hypothetical protein B7733_04800 [Myxococcales bacterium FL481]